eukprot:4041706-Pyramimonas_sp.AAC.4
MSHADERGEGYLEGQVRGVCGSEACVDRSQAFLGSSSRGPRGARTRHVAPMGGHEDGGVAARQIVQGRQLSRQVGEHPLAQTTPPVSTPAHALLREHSENSESR